MGKPSVENVIKALEEACNEMYERKGYGVTITIALADKEKSRS